MKKLILLSILLIVGCEDNAIAVSISPDLFNSSVQGYFLETEDGIDVFKKLESEEYCLNSSMCTVNECDSTIYADYYNQWGNSQYINCNNQDSSYYSLILQVGDTLELMVYFIDNSGNDVTLQGYNPLYDTAQEIYIELKSYNNFNISQIKLNNTILATGSGNISSGNIKYEYPLALKLIGLNPGIFSFDMDVKNPFWFDTNYYTAVRVIE